MAIEFVSPGKSRLSASASLTEAEITRIRAAATPEAKVDFVMAAEVVGDDGAVVARTRGEYQLRPFGR
jgi:hypothetical protein